MSSARDLLGLLGQLDKQRSSLYQPYPKQAEFHAAGRDHRQRGLMAGNRCGKTFSGGMEMSYHLTGLYPDWWVGRRFSGPIQAWVAGQTNETTRDVPQKMLMGAPGEWGTGTLPAHTIVKPVIGRGIADALDSVQVRHVTGGLSRAGFKQYEQGRLKWQGADIDVEWLDEECPPDIYSEGVTRTHDRDGIVYITFTPLLGMSEVVGLFYPEPANPNLRHLTRMELEDVGHFTEEQKRIMVETFPPHERESREKGIPMLGSGKIFPVSEDLFLEDPIQVPDHFFQLGGIDFGWDHPTACVRVAEDRDNDCLHVTHAYRQKEQTPVVHAAAMRAWGKWLPWSWPQDGYQRDKQSGIEIASAYRDQGVQMLPQHAQYATGSNGLEAGLMEMLDRFKTGRLKINRNLVQIVDEVRLYHRKDGDVVKMKDDLICAIRYAVMMRRFGVQRGAHRIQVRSQGPYQPFSKRPQQAAVGGLQ